MGYLDMPRWFLAWWMSVWQTPQYKTLIATSSAPVFLQIATRFTVTIQSILRVKQISLYQTRCHGLARGVDRGAGRGLAPYGPQISIEHLNFD